MSSTTGPTTGRTTARAEPYAPEEHGRGWVVFAAILLGVVGTMNVIYGIGAIDDANVYVGDQKYVFGDLNTWGWFLVVVGAVQLAAAVGIWNRAEWARWLGVLFASGNIILQLLFLPGFPLLSLSLMAMDILVIYGLVQYGGKRSFA